MLQPFLRDDSGGLSPNLLPGSLLFPVRSRECLPRCYRKRCAPNRRKWLLSLENTQHCEELIAQLISMPSVPLQHDYSHSGRETLLYVVPGLKRSNHLAPLLVRSLPQLSLDKRRCLRDATRIAPQSTDSRQRAYSTLPCETGRVPSARADVLLDAVSRRIIGWHQQSKGR